jgi:hypothetical protein
MGFFLVAIYELETYLKSKEVAQYYSMQSNEKGLDRRSFYLSFLLFLSYRIHFQSIEASLLYKVRVVFFKKIT